MTSPTMDLQEAANTLKVHPHTLEKMIRAGDIPAGKLGRSYLLLTRDVLAYAEKIILKQTANRLRQLASEQYRILPCRTSPTAQADA